MPVPPKQPSVSVEVFKPLQLAKPWYCEPVPAKIGEKGPAAPTEKNGRKIAAGGGPEWTHSGADRALSVSPPKVGGAS